MLADGLGRVVARRSARRRFLVARHLRRARPGLEGRALERAVDDTFRTYARYWAESFRLPALSEAEVDFGFSVENFGAIERSLAAGRGTILVLPHLGGWEWAGFWLTRVRGIPVTVVVEPVEPPSLFEFFVEFRERLGMNIVPLGPGAGREILLALRAGHIVCLLADRDITGDGVEVEFFGERTTIPAGPATIGLRSGATLLPAAVYFTPDGGHRAVVLPAVEAERHGRLREDVTRVTQELVHRLEELITIAPEQWHLQQPNWPSDHEALQRVDAASSLGTRRAVRS